MTMKFKNRKDDFFLQAFDLLSHYKYAYGAKRSTGILTSQKLAELAKNSPKMYTSEYKVKTAKNIGSHVIDCSGLVCKLWNISDIGSSQLADLPNYNDAYQFVTIKTGNLLWGDCLWKSGHVGVYIGDGLVLEAKGIDAGIRVSKLADTNWRKAIRNLDLHFYGRIGWCIDEVNGQWWYTYGESKGEYLKNCIVEMDAFGTKYEFDSVGYSKKVK